MSAPAFGTIGTLHGSSTSTPAFAVPASVASGDIIVVAFYAAVSSTTISAFPSGFAAAENSPRTVNAGGTGSHVIHVAWKRATGSDTGTYAFTLSGTVFVYGNAVRYTGCVAAGNPWDSPTNAADGGNSILTTAPAVSVTTLGPDRMLFYVASDESGDGGTWTPPSGLTQRQGGVNATNCEISDLVQAAAGSSGNLSATTTAGGADRMGAWLGALIGTTASGSIPAPPQRVAQPRDPGEAWWLQRDRRDANTVADPANPLPSPLDVAYGAGGPIWHQRGGAADAAARTWTAQQRTYSDPSLLTPAATMPTAPPARTVQARDYGEAQWLQPVRRDPQLLTTSLLENELLGGAETITRTLSPITNAPRWWMPQQPQREGFAPGLLDSAELEGALLGGAGTAQRTNLPATHTDRRSVPQQRQVFADTAASGVPYDLAINPGWQACLLAALHVDRREVPQQRPYISDPSFYPTVTPTDPLTLAYGASGTYWLLYNTAGLQVDRRDVPQQRRYTSDPALLTTALLEDVLLGSAATAEHLAWFTDRRLMPQQRTASADPATAVTDPLALAYGAGGSYSQLYNTAVSHADRREVPLQRPYISDPALLATALLEGVLLGGGDTTRHAFFVTDRRSVPQQPPRADFVGGLPADPLFLGGDRWLRLAVAATHADRRETVAQRLALIFVGTDAPAVVKAASAAAVSARRGSSAAVAANRTSTGAVTDRRTSSGGVS